MWNLLLQATKAFLMQIILSRAFLICIRSLSKIYLIKLFIQFYSNMTYGLKHPLLRSKIAFVAWSNGSHLLSDVICGPKITIFISIYHLEPGEESLILLLEKNTFFQKFPKLMSRRDYNHIQHIIQVQICRKCPKLEKYFFEFYCLGLYWVKAVCVCQACQHQYTF